MNRIADMSWERMARAVERVRERLLRMVQALEAAGVPYAVIGDNAVAAWVSRVDESAVRNTREVDDLLRRSDFAAAKSALQIAGFVYRHAKNLDMFLDGPAAKARDAVHVIFAGEKVRVEDAVAAPDVRESARAGGFALIELDALVRMKLTAYRDKDRMHLRDLLDALLIDASWPARFPPPLGTRLQQLIDTPEG